MDNAFDRVLYALAGVLDGRPVTVERDHALRIAIAGRGRVVVDLWDLGPSGAEMVRVRPGDEGSALRPHFSLTISDTDGQQFAGPWLLHEPEEIAAEVGYFLAPVRTVSPDDLVIAPPPSTSRLATEISVDARLDIELPDALVSRLSDDERNRLDETVSSFDLERALRHWPRDGRGRLAVKERALLAVFGVVPSTKRQPCLLLWSAATRKGMSAFRLALSEEFRLHHRHAWVYAPHLWTMTPEPLDPDSAVELRPLMRAGRVGTALIAAGVVVDDELVRLVAHGTFRRRPVDPAWRREAEAVLAVLAPWKLPDTARRVRADLEVGRGSRLKAGGWERKILWFSGQRRQVKLGLGLRELPDGSPWLGLMSTASNAVLADVWWQDM